MVPLLAARPIAATADFRRFGHPQPLPINHLLCENRKTQGRMAEVGLIVPSTTLHWFGAWNCTHFSQRLSPSG